MTNKQQATIFLLSALLICTCALLSNVLQSPAVPAPIPTATSILRPTPTLTLPPTWTPTPTPSYGDDIGACLICRQFVEDRLIAPGFAKWPHCWENIIGFDEESKSWDVASYVDSQNSFGALLRSQYICEVEHLGGDKWRLLALEFDQ